MAEPPEPDLDSSIAGEVPLEAPRELRVSPATSPKHHNVVRVPLRPVACWRMDELWFDFDSSFVRPEARAEFPMLHAMRVAKAGALLSVFGHADPVGDDAYNKKLSGRRADAVYGMLTRDTVLWETLYSQPQGGDNWGLRSVQIMLRTAGHDPGTADGKMGKRTNAAVRAFQTVKGLTVDGDPGPKTRAALFAVYMDAVCVDDHDVPRTLQKTDFLGKGADSGGKADRQGCGEFNPLIVFSRSDRQRYTDPALKEERDGLNAPNRRVVVYFFPPGELNDVSKWPCPRTSEGHAGCRKRFWSDGDQRRSPQEQRRKFQEMGDTFACRFYERMVVHSPCETYLVRDFIRIEDELGEPVAHTNVKCLMTDGTEKILKTDARGMILVQGNRLVRVELEEVHRIETA